MELTKKQQEALKITLERYKNNEKYTIISGYAGSGKSTVLKHIIHALPINPELDVAYITFTGKAANVLAKKGCPNATTAHKLLYQAIPKPDGTYIFKERTALEHPYKVVCCDEVSMLPKKMWNLLMRHNVYVIALGDPFQIPPIDPDEDNHMLDNPHVFLDEIMRQAADSGIIRLSMLIREGKDFSNFKSEDAVVFNKSELSTGMLTWSDIIICGTNKTRHNLNQQARKLYGFEGPIQNGEKVICLHNDWDKASTNTKIALTNGAIGTLTNVFEDEKHYPKWLGLKDNKLNFITGDFLTDEGDSFPFLKLDSGAVYDGKMSISPQSRFKMSRSEKFSEDVPREFNLGYAITCHKAQGSQWDKVLVVEEKFPFDKTEHARWLYTAVTRGASRVVLVR